MSKRKLIDELERLGLIRPARPPAPRDDQRPSKAAAMAKSLPDLERMLMDAKRRQH